MVISEQKDRWEPPMKTKDKFDEQPVVAKRIDKDGETLTK